MSSTELVVIDQEMVKAALLDGTALPGVDDPEQVGFQIRASILAAETVDAILGAFESEGWGELENVPIEVQGVAWRRSAMVNGLPVYAVVHGIRLDSGEAVALTTGGGSVMAALYRMDQLEAFPQVLAIYKSKANADGNQTLLLKRVPKAQLPPPADHGGALDVD